MQGRWTALFEAEKQEKAKLRDQLIATQEDYKHLEKQPIDAAIFNQVAENVRQLEQLRAALAVVLARQQQQQAKTPETKAPSIATAELVASLTPIDVVSVETSATCAA